MDRLSPVIFGDFVEEERFLYFSDEAVQSSGVEFPDDFYLFTYGTAYSKPVDTPNDEDITPSVETADISNAENGMLENISKEKQTLGDLSTNAGQVSVDCNEIISVESSDISQNSDQRHVNITPEVQISSSKEQNNEVRSALDKNILNHSNLQNGSPSEQVSSPNSNNPTNVVTVGTKTMMTTSTRTVESRNEGVKSSWADLFKTKSSSKPQGPLPQTKYQKPPQQSIQNLEDSNLSKKDQFQHYFLEVLRNVLLTNKVPSLQPRGLKNNGNWCYINSTLQVLLFCPSFYHFLMKFRLKGERGASLTPILDALVLFASQFSEVLPQQLTGKSREWNKQELVMGMSFEPKYIYDLLSQVKTTLSQQGKQEDAEEFLSFILNGLHDELVQIATQNSRTKEDTGIHDEMVGEQVIGDWEQVGPRNKSTVTRKAAMSKSPVAAMFGGYLRSSLVQPGMKESASIQPFFTIPLDLRGDVNTVQQAFDNFFRVEEVEGFQCDKSKTEVEVSKKWTLDTLPVILVLHLKRFVVNKNGCEKLTKKISYDSCLSIPDGTLSKVNKIRNKNAQTYKLIAVTYHHGKNLNGGHYTSDIAHPVVGWLRTDDMNVKLVPPKFVFNPLSNRDPYLLYYCRGDISTKAV